MIPMRLITIVSVLFITACSGLGRSPDASLPDGSIITLNQPVTVPRNQVAASVRGGFIGTQQDFEGSCRLELWTLSSEPRVIEPDEFVVERTNWRREYFGGFHPMNSYASVRIGEGPNLFWYITFINLSSEKQPDIFRLRCRHLQQSENFPNYLTVQQIQTIVGDVMTLNPAVTADTTTTAP